MFSWGNPKIICWFAKQFLNSYPFNFPGKILNDETALKEYKIDEKNFVVVMVTKVSNHYFWMRSFINLILFFLVMSDCICSSLKPLEFHHMQVLVNSKNLCELVKNIASQSWFAQADFCCCSMLNVYIKEKDC